METLSAAMLRQWLERVRRNLDGIVTSLAAQYPGVTIRTFESPVGSLTEFQAYDVGLEASFPTYDCVALVVCAAYLTTTPRVSADVSWNAEAPGGVEACTWDNIYSATEWPVASAETIAQIDSELPRLVDALRGAIARYLGTGR